MVAVIRFKNDGALFMLRPEIAAVFIKLNLAEYV